MTWPQRLKRVFNVDMETCHACGGALWIIACIEDPEVIEKILNHIWSAPRCKGAFAVYMKDMLQSYIRHLLEGLYSLVP